MWAYCRGSVLTKNHVRYFLSRVAHMVFSLFPVCMLRLSRHLINVVGPPLVTFNEVENLPVQVDTFVLRPQWDVCAMLG